MVTLSSSIRTLAMALTVGFFSAHLNAQTDSVTVELKPDPSVGLFKAANKDSFESWKSIHSRILNLWDLNSNESKQLYNRAESTSSEANIPPQLMMKAMFDDYNQWVTGEIQKIQAQVKERNHLDVQVGLPANVSPYHRALLLASYYEDLKAKEAQLKSLPAFPSETTFIILPSPEKLIAANANFKAQFAPYSAKGVSLRSFLTKEKSAIESVLPGRSASFELQLDDSAERMQLLRGLLASHIKREFRMGQNGPEIVFSFSRRAEIDTPAKFYVKKAGEVEVFKLKNTEASREFVSFFNGLEAKDQNREWGNFNPVAKTFTAAIPSLKREAKTNYVWFEPGSEIRATRVTPTGESFSTTSVDAMTKDEIMGSRYIYSLNLDSVIGASAVLTKAPAKAPEAAKEPGVVPAKKDENEEDIIKKLKRTQLLPDPLEELHPAYCARRTT